MTDKTPQPPKTDSPAPPSPEPAPAVPGKTREDDKARPDPVRYGDWEKNGRCIDF